MTEITRESVCEGVSLRSLAYAEGEVAAMEAGERVCAYKIGDTVCPLTVQFEFGDCIARDRILNPEGELTAKNMALCPVRQKGIQG